MGDMNEPGFAVWLTGLPASGKTTIAAALAGALGARGVVPAVLDSDELRDLMTPKPRFDEVERELFYSAIAVIARELCRHGVSVVIAATGNRQRHRDRARDMVERFVEVFVDCPIEVCERRDPKGLYDAALGGAAPSVPGIGSPYEPPRDPELTVRSDRESAVDAAGRIVEWLEERGYFVDAAASQRGGAGGGDER